MPVSASTAPARSSARLHDGTAERLPPASGSMVSSDHESGDTLVELDARPEDGREHQQDGHHADAGRFQRQQEDAGAEDERGEVLSDVALARRHGRAALGGTSGARRGSGGRMLDFVIDRDGAHRGTPFGMGWQ